MKKSKILVPAVALLGLSIAGATTGTVAWFSMNTIVAAEGMKIYSTTPSSLVIATTPKVGTLTTVAYTAAAKELAPATHDGGYDSNLKQVISGDKIDPHTGYEKTGETLTSSDYADAVANTNYVDYTCYIASAGNPIIDGKKLKVELTFTSTARIEGQTEDVTRTFKAASVDFYVSSVTNTSTGEINGNAWAKGNYKDTLNAAGVEQASDGSQSVKTSVEIFTTSSSTPIPSNVNDSLRIDMRIYFDGNLNDPNSKYVDPLDVTGTEHAMKYVVTDFINTTYVNIRAVFSLTGGDDATTTTSQTSGGAEGGNL